MALTADNVVVGVTGKVYVGATSATAPTASDSALTGFTELGYVADSGLEISTDKSSTNIKAWQDSALVRTVITESSSSFKFTMLETNENVLELYFGANMVAGKIQLDPASTGGRKSFVIDIVDDTKVIRYYLPAAEVVATDPIAVTSGDPIMYGVEVRAYKTDGRAADVFFSEFE